jgi:hypothetical protein
LTGVIHYACGDKEAGDNAMKKSSRTLGIYNKMFEYQKRF